jgi:hypothetical protein
MAQVDKKHFGKGTQGKGDGTGAMTSLPKGLLEENQVLSNRDKKQHTKDRGQDSAAIRTEQRQDDAGSSGSSSENGRAGS